MKIRSLGFLAASVMVVMMLSLSVAQAEFITVWQAGNVGAGWPLDGVGGGVDVDFVQETGVNAPPGDPNSPAVAQQADDDYYFAGTYPAPIGVVANDEIAFERAFAGIDNDLRIHFNLPATLNPADKFRFSFEANNLDERAENADPRYGVEIYFNDVLIAPERVIRVGELSTVFTTDVFTAADVNAIGGLGIDNVLRLTGISKSGDGGGAWMGMDFHQLEIEPIPEPSSIVLLVLGSLLLFPLARRKK